MADEERQTTSEPLGDAARPRRRSAVTIDLEPEKDAASDTARAETEAGSGKGATDPGGAARPRTAGTVAPPPSNRGSGWSAIGFALIGAIAVGLALYLLMFTDLLPAPGADDAEAARDETAALETQIAQLQAALAEQGDTFNTAIGEVPQIDLGPIEARLAALETQIAELADTETGIETDIAGLTETANQLAAELEAETAARADLADELDELRRQSVAVAAAGGDPDAAAQLGADINALAERVDGLEGNAGGEALAALQVDVAALGGRLAALENAAPPEEIAALRTELDALAVETQALAVRTDALAETTDALAADAGNQGEAALAARALAIANIRNALDRGEPFASELDLLAELGVPAADLEALRAASAAGVASVAVLQAEFPDVADAILTASAATDEDANFLQRLLDNARNAIVVEPTVPVEGDDAPAIVSRMRGAVEAGEFATALAERQGLPPEGIEASAEWAALAEARVAVEADVEQLGRSLAGGVSE